MLAGWFKNSGGCYLDGSCSASWGCSEDVSQRCSHFKANFWQKYPVSSLLLAEGLNFLSCELFSSATWVSSCHGSCLFPEQIIQVKGPGRSHNMFYVLIAEITQWHFCLLVSLKSESLKYNLYSKGREYKGYSHLVKGLLLRISRYGCILKQLPPTGKFVQKKSF